MSNQDSISKDRVVHELRRALDGKLDQEKIDAAVASLSATTASYSAVGYAVGVLFYARVHLSIPSGGFKEFNGDTGGFFGLGGSGFGGTLYTDDVANLFANTTSFSATFAGSFFTHLFFFDAHGNHLGRFEGGGTGSLEGGGSGSGRWG